MRVYLLLADDKDYYTNTDVVAVFSSPELAEQRQAEMAAWDKASPYPGGFELYDAWVAAHPYGKPGMDRWYIRPFEVEA